MASKINIREVLLYEFNLGSTAAAAARKINESFEKNTVNERTAQRWFQKFRSGLQSLDDQHRSGRPVVVDVASIERLVRMKPEFSLNEIARETGSSYGSVQSTIKSLGLIWKRGRYVPHELSHANKVNRMRICRDNLRFMAHAPNLKRIMTSDEKWVFFKNTRPKNQWLEPGIPSAAVPKVSQHDKKVMLCIWWDYRGPIHFELLEPGQTVNSDLYIDQLTRVNAELNAKRPELRGRSNVIFLHDNARPHVSNGTRRKINEFGWTLLPHPPYSPDLAPSDYHLFRSLSHFLKDKIYNNKNEVKNDIDLFLASKSVDFYTRGIFDLPNRWQKAIEHDGDYFPDDD